MPFGAVVEGEVVDPQAVSGAIASLWKSGNIGSKEVAVGVANQKVVVRLIDLPFMEKDELAGAIQYQAQDYIPIPVEEAILTYEVIGDYVTAADEHMMEVLLVAAARDMIGTLVQTVESAGLKLVQIDLAAFALMRALIGGDEQFLPEADTGAVGIVHITSGLTNIVVAERGVPRFTRVSAFGGKQFTQAISNTMGMNYDAAEDLKIRAGLPSVDGSPIVVPGYDAEMISVAHQALEREANKFIGEVRRSLDYYLTQATQARTIKRIVITGSGSMLRNLPLYLERGLQTDVVLGDPLAFVSVAPGAESIALADRMGSAPAIGLALAGVM